MLTGCWSSSKVVLEWFPMLDVSSLALSSVVVKFCRWFLHSTGHWSTNGHCNVKRTRHRKNSPFLQCPWLIIAQHMQLTTLLSALTQFLFYTNTLIRATAQGKVKKCQIPIYILWHLVATPPHSLSGNCKADSTETSGLIAKKKSFKHSNLSSSLFRGICNILYPSFKTLEVQLATCCISEHPASRWETDRRWSPRKSDHSVSMPGGYVASESVLSNIHMNSQIETTASKRPNKWPKWKQKQHMVCWNDPRRRLKGGSARACEPGAPTPYGLVPNGQQALPLPPPPAFHKGSIHCGERVGGCKTVDTSFEGDGIHR